MNSTFFAGFIPVIFFAALSAATGAWGFVVGAIIGMMLFHLINALWLM